MNQGGFLDSRKSSPVGLGLVIAGHVAVLTAIALAPPDAIQRIIFVDTIATNIPDTPPPPADPPPAGKIEQPSRPTQIDRIVAVDPGRSPVFLDPLPPPDLGPPISLEPVRSAPVIMPPLIDPAAMARFQPDYPPDLIRAAIEGTATVRVLIGSDGRVKAVELVSATQPGFFEATKRQALRFWKFRPGTSDGIAVESWRTMTVRFKIQG